MIKRDDQLTNDIVADYKNMLKNIPMLSDDEEKNLFLKYQKDKSSLVLNEIVPHFLYLVVSIVDSYAHYCKHLSYMDLIQEGNEALVKAVSGFDLSFGTKFSVYASSCIRACVTEALSENNDMICYPKQFSLQLLRYRKMLKKYRKTHCDFPDDSYFCFHMNLSLEDFQVVKMVESIKSISLQEAEYELQNYKDVGSYECEFLDWAQRNYDSNTFFKVCKSILKPSQYLAFYYRYFLDKPMSFQEIANIFYSKKQNAAALCERAFYNIKPYLEDDSLYLKKAKELREQEGENFKYLDVRPLHPRDIVRFLYAFPYLTVMEKKLFRLSLLGPYDISLKPIYQFLEISLQEYVLLLENFKVKLKSIFSDFQKYKSLEEACLRVYKTKIYDVDFNSNSSFFDNQDVQRRLDYPKEDI